MEHAVPQNVTSFEFHLVGDMTLKQFAYLGTGLGIAFLVFSTLFSSLPYLAIPIMAISALSGIALAFLPILDRPFDHWVIAFFRSIYSPTKGEFKTAPGVNRLQAYLSNINTAPQNILRPIRPLPAPIAAPQPVPDEKEKLVELMRQNELLQKKLSEAEKRLNSIRPTPPAPPKPNFQPVATKMPRAVVVETAKPVQTQMLLTSFPNVINGLVEDLAGNYLEGVIVIIHNKDNIPVRALKTNKLGQFSGATPLPPGVYTVTLEKEGFTFDTLQMTLTGDVLSPLTIKPKNQ